jgi:transaldolase
MIFAKATTGSERYDEQLRSLASDATLDTRELFFAIALEDVRRAAAVLPPIHEQTGGGDGVVSFDCTPDLADDTGGTIAQALGLWRRPDLPNVLIKVPATAAGVGAIEELTARGVNVNVTLPFSIERTEEVIEAYLCGLERRVAAGDPVDGVSSVASFFVSRADAKADALLAPGSSLRGEVAIANARVAYGRYLARFGGERWEALEARGARPQRPLWATTGTKDPSYPDVLYVEKLIAPGVNTMPEQTLRAFAEHDKVEHALDADPAAAQATLSAAAEEGVDLGTITGELEREGVKAFCDSYEQLLACIESKLGSLITTS